MDINQKITGELGVKKWQVDAAVKLIDEGNTIPFIARYRKEATGTLDDEQLRKLYERLTYLRNLEEKKEQVLSSIEEQGKLTEELRAQIRGSGIGTSATRAEILKKLFSIKYLSLNKKTQVITPTLLGEMIFDVVNCSIRQLLNPELTASWEKGLTYVAEGSITPQEYMDKLEHFVRVRTVQVEQSNYQYALRQFFDAAAENYKKKPSASKRGGKEL